MTWFEAIMIVLAGLAAGTINTIVGSGTLVTFPTLIAFGFDPRIATMSNAIGQVAGGASGTWGYRRELTGQRGNIVQQMPASLAGAVVGALLLLILPPDAFRTIVPFLLVFAIVLVLAGPALKRRAQRRAAAANRDAAAMTPARRVAVIGSTFLIGVYGGYFTAAQGVLLVSVMSVLLPETLQRVNALKNVLSLTTNIVAATMYAIIAFHEIAWGAAGLIAIGTLCGGLVGARVGRRLPPIVLRGIIVALAAVALWRLLA